MTPPARPEGRGSKPTFNYPTDRVVKFVQENIELGIIVPGVKAVMDDMAATAGRSASGSAPLYNRYPGGMEEIVELSGLKASGINRVALIPEECPDFVLREVVEALGRDALLGYMLRTADSEFLDTVRQQLDDLPNANEV